MKSKLWIFIIGLYLFFIPNVVIAAEDTSQMEQLNYLSDEALQLTKSHRYEEAKKILEAFSNKFSTVTIKEQAFTMDELRIVTLVHNEAVEATTNVTMAPDERINQVIKFRLVVDAISSTTEPLWTEMKTPMLNVYNEVKKAAINGESEAFNKSLNSLLSLYEIVSPSMKIDVPVVKIQQLDTKVKYIDHYRMDVLNEEGARQQLLNLEMDLQSVFSNISEDNSDPSIWWVMISTGSIIIVTLSYVGWRKYKGEKEKGKKPSR